MTFLRIFWIALIALGLVLMGSPSEAVKPLAPLEVELKLDGVPQIGGEVKVSIRVRSILDAPNIKIQCTLPAGVTLVTGEDNWQGEMAADTLKEMILLLKINEAGQHVIRVMATIEYPGGAKISKGEALLIDLGSESDGGSTVLGIESNQAESKQKAKPVLKKRPLIRKGKNGQDIGEFPLD